MKPDPDLDPTRALGKQGNDEDPSSSTDEEAGSALTAAFSGSTPTPATPTPATPTPATPTPATPAANDLPAQLGRFQIHGMLGRGGFGTVYLGYDERLRRRVAIKVPRQVLSGVELDRFLEEARHLAQLRHPGIVTVFDVGEAEGRCYIVSDYLEGLSLKDWMQAQPRGWPEAAAIVASLAEALAHAHALGTVHRDVKPSNVIMLPDDQPVLIDFGLAVSDTEGGAEAPGRVAGTLAYMSPEQAAGKAHRIDGRTDIYGLGVMLYQMICGKLPFRSTSRLELLRQIREDDPQPLRQIVPDVPAALEQVCLKAIAKRIQDRFTTAIDMASQLRRALEQADETTTAPARAAAPASTLESAAAYPTSSEYRLHEAERRQITTLHLDLDDTGMEVDDLDPEELHAVLQRVRELTARVIGRYGGHVAQSVSESIHAYFGYPKAHEDAARRAVLAGLGIRDEISRLQQQLRATEETSVEFRIGIHTGIVVTEEQETEMSSERHSIVGNVPRVAAGLAALAEPGAVVISGTTRRIVGDGFAGRSLGTHSGRSIGRGLEVFAIDGQLHEETAAPSLESAPLIGREHELGLLREKWRLAESGAGQVVLMCAEAGVGKSRLLSAFCQDLDDAPRDLLHARCSTYQQNSAFHPLIELLKRQAGFVPEDSSETKLAKLEGMLDGLGIPLGPVVPLLTDLLSVPLGPRYPVFEGTPERRKQRTIEALVEWMLVMCESRPLMITVEDLHWIDPSTLEFLTVLIDQAPAAPILVVLTFRPSFTPPWPQRPSLAQLMISQLNAEQTQCVIEKICGDRRLPAEVVAQIVEKTGGVPLFTEELTKAVLESDIWEHPASNQLVLARPLAALAIPDTLQDSLMARLDRLGGAKEVAQLASVIGREFAFALLAAVAPLDEATLQTELTQLVESELLYQRGFFPRAKFTFKHALVEDVAYGSLLRKTRQQWHDKIADVLTAQFPHDAQSAPELLARHYTEAGRIPEAIAAWTQAGLRAQEASAHQEAISQFRTGLGLAAGMEPSADRDALEFQFQIPLGVSLLASQGYAAPEVGPVFERARELAEQLGGPVEQFHILWGIWAWRVVREELAQCLKFSEQAIAIAAAAADPGLQAEALFIPALTKFYLGDFVAVVRCAEQGFSLYDDQRCRTHARHTGQNVGVTMQCYWALALWHLGYPDQAIERVNQAVELARNLRHSFSLAYALGHSAWLHHHARLGEGLKQAASEELALAQQQGFLFWIAEGLLHQGFSLRLEKRFEESLASLESGLQIFHQTGAKLSLGHFYSEVASAHLGEGNAEEALNWIDRALEASATHGNAFHLAEIHRLRGEILLALPGDRRQEAESCFQQSLEVARSQQAKSWELRTTISLCRLWQSQGLGTQAHEALERVYSWFQEGFDTPDLLAARQLLGELA